MKYGFLGCGNMGGAIARALAKTTKNIMLTSKSAETAVNLSKELGCEHTSDNAALIETCDVVFLAVKPQMAADVLTPLVPLLQKYKPVLVSMAAGLTLSRIEAMAGGSLPVVRIMPNTPVSIGKGMITYCYNSLVDASVVNTILQALCHAGRFDRIEETQMDAATAAAGCSPAYAYMFIDAIAQGAEACGLPREKALVYAAEAVAGAAQLLLTSGKEPSDLKNAVCSPGGSTLAGVKVLEEEGFVKITADAICSAYKRNIELGK